MTNQTIYVIIDTEREVQIMNALSLPPITGIDKIKVYHNNKLLAEQWAGGASLTWYFKECETLKPYNEQTIQEMSICIEGCLSEIVVCEIILF